MWSPGPAAASRAAGVTAARPPRAARSGRWSFVCDGPGPAGLRGSPAPSLLAARRGRPRRRRRPLGRRTARGLLGREAGESRELRPPGRPSPRGQAFGPGVRGPPGRGPVSVGAGRRLPWRLVVPSGGRGWAVWSPRAQARRGPRGWGRTVARPLPPQQFLLGPRRTACVSGVRRGAVKLGPSRRAWDPDFPVDCPLTPF